MIPDKIYIAETPNKLIEIWSDEPIESKSYITEHEYIRKDALIEILQGYSHPLTKLVMQEIIEKINSL